MQDAQAVLDFWFVEHGPKDWFGGDPAFDEKLAARFSDLHAQVARGEAWQWRETPEGRLAEVIVLDQFSRQLHRGKPEAFAQDLMALALAQEAVSAGADDAVDHAWAKFFYMPHMHAESLIVQEEGVRLYENYGDEGTLDFMKEHRDAIAKFGRFPKRNAALGRKNTPEESAYIDAAGDRMF
jgi:uncharacterized protein (DUF924 family)